LKKYDVEVSTRASNIRHMTNRMRVSRRDFTFEIFQIKKPARGSQGVAPEKNIMI
jgi:hypothetical protein